MYCSLAHYKIDLVVVENVDVSVGGVSWERSVVYVGWVGVFIVGFVIFFVGMWGV